MSARDRTPPLSRRLIRAPIDFVWDFIDSVACLYVSMNPIVGLPEAETVRYAGGYFAGSGSLCFALALFGLPITTMAVALPHAYALFPALAFGAALAAVGVLSVRAGTLNRRYLEGVYTPRVRRVDLAILVIWNLFWPVTAFVLWVA